METYPPDFHPVQRVTGPSTSAAGWHLVRRCAPLLLALATVGLRGSSEHDSDPHAGAHHEPDHTPSTVSEEAESDHTVPASGQRAGIQQLSWDLPKGPTAVSPLAAGTPQFAHFGPALFGGAHNFDGVAQTIDGRIFVIAEHRLLVGTGERWEPVENLPEENARHLHLTADGRLYVSLDDDFGYFDLDESLHPSWRSISENLPSEWVRGAQWKPLYEGDDGYVYFVGSKHVFAHHPEKTLLLWKDVGFVDHIFTLHGKPHVLTESRSVFRLEKNGDLEVVARDLPPTFTDIRAGVTLNEEEHLFACGPAGLATYNGHHFTPLPLKGIEQSHFVPDQLLRIGPDLFVALDYAHGLLVFRSDGTVLRQVHQFGDLKARIAQAVTIDRDGWIWLAHASGLYRINAASPQTSFNYNHGLEGRVLCMTEHDGEFFVGTEDGLFVWSQPRPEEAGRFLHIADVPPVYSLVSTDEGIAAGTRRGLWVIDGRGPYLVQTGDHRLVLKSPRAHGVLIAPTLDGIREFRHQGQRWVPATDAPHLPTTGMAAAISREGVLWAEYGPGRIARFGFGQTEDYPTVFSPKEGLPLSLIEPIVTDEELLFRGGDTLYRFLPDRTLFTRTDAWKQLEHAIGGNPANRAVESPEGALWVADSILGRHYRPFPSPGFEYAWPDIRRFGHDPITSIYIDSIGYLWVGNGRGLLRFRPHPDAPRKAFERQTLVHRVSSDLYDEPLADLPNGVINLDLKTFPALQPHLRFEFSLLDYTHPGGTTYSTFLEGFDHDWQDFHPEAAREVTDLPPGDYLFHVKGRTRYGEEGLPATIRFTLPISPFNTWWARGLYVVVGGMLLGFVHLLRQRQLLRKQKKLAKELEAREKRLAEQAAELELNREHLEAANEQVESLAAEAKALHRDRAHFEADLSHALRPAVISITHLGRLLSPDKLEAPARRLFEGIRLAGEHLVGALREHLDLRRLEIDHLPVEQSEFDLRSPIEESLAMLADQAHAKGIELNYTIEPGLAVVRHGDPLRIKQVLCHLLANAVEHTSKGDVTISVRRMQGRSTDYAEFVVVDNGPGLDRDAQNRLLAESDPKQRPRYRGAPQGLSIARHLLQALDGDLSIESTPEEGARVHFHLNLPPPAPAPKPTPAAFEEKFVLIIDDNPTTLKSLQQVAEENGLQTRLAYDSPQALEALKEKPGADLVWIDEKLESTLGHELLAQIRQGPGNPDLPAVVLAPHANEPELLLLAKDPHTVVLRKPFHHGPLLATSLGLLGGRRAAPVEPPVEVDGITEEDDADTGDSGDQGPLQPDAEDPLEAKIRAALARSNGESPDEGSPSDASTEKPADHPSRLRILLLDPHPVHPLATLDLLRRVGYNARIVDDVTAAIGALENDPYDLIMLTTPLPEQSLAEATEQIRRNLPPDCDPLFVALGPSLEPSAREAGILEHLRTPLDPETLSRLLRLIQLDEENGASPLPDLED